MLLLIDNRDSFTYNLVQYFLELGAEVQVRRAPELDLQGVLDLNPSGVITGPGPGHPSQAELSLALARDLPRAIPLLGVCLGHQALALAYGAKIRRGIIPMHGRTSHLGHTGEGLFEGLPQGFAVGRYHSLVVDAEGLPEELLICATTSDGEIQALAHRDKPHFGIQFHPESILSECGHRLLWNFVLRTGEDVELPSVLESMGPQVSRLEAN